MYIIDLNIEYILYILYKYIKYIKHGHLTSPSTSGFGCTQIRNENAMFLQEIYYLYKKRQSLTYSTE